MTNAAAKQAGKAPTVSRRQLMSDTASNRLLFELGRFGLVIALAIVLLTFSLWKPDSFFIWGNFRGTFDQQSIILMVALGAMVPLIIGEFDLSIGANAGVAGIATVGLCQKSGWDPVLAIVVGVVLSTIIGLINGMLVMRLKLNSFVATLGTSTVLLGLSQAYTGGIDLTNAPPDLVKIGRAEVIGLPLPVVVALVTAAILFIVLQKLPFGRQILAVGANRRAAQLTGIRPERKILWAFGIGGMVAGIGGALYSAELGSGTLTLGGTLLLPAFAAAFLGATTITPGRFNVLGTIFAVLLLAFTVSGLQQVGVDPWIQSVVQGVALIIAVAFSSWARDLRTARLRAAQLEVLAASAEREQAQAA